MDENYFIANVRHIAWVAFQIAAGQPYNVDINKDQFDSLVDGINYLKTNPNSTAEETHNNWMRMKKDQGWKYGKDKDFKSKTHPDLMPFKSLPIIEQRRIFLLCQLACDLLEEMERSENKKSKGLVPLAVSPGRDCH